MENDPVIGNSALSRAVDLLRGDPRIGAAYLHGSSVKAGLRPDSDVDIALLPTPGARLGMGDRLDLAARLEDILGRTVDLGLLSTQNVVYAKEVIGFGKLLFTRDRLASHRFAALALSMFADLQRQRKEILDAYAA